MTEKELLEEQLNKLNETTILTLDNWRTETLPIIAEIFTEKSPQYNQFINIGLYAMHGYKQVHIDDFKHCLTGMIKCLDIRKNQNKKTLNTNKNNVIINNNPNFSQTQTQTQTQTMDIKDIIKDELPPARMREIEAILKENEPKETKLQKICDVLQKVGIGVVSSTLSKIITSSMGIF